MADTLAAVGFVVVILAGVDVYLVWKCWCWVLGVSGKVASVGGRLM